MKTRLVQFQHADNRENIEWTATQRFGLRASACLRHLVKLQLCGSASPFPGPREVFEVCILFIGHSPEGFRGRASPAAAGLRYRLPARYHSLACSSFYFPSILSCFDTPMTCHSIRLVGETASKIPAGNVT